jgi:hypothetical protein
MSRDDLSRMRRQDLARDDAWIRAFLRAVPFGFLAAVADGRPFLVPNLFVYDDSAHALYFHTARSGRTATNLAEPAPVTFAAGAMGRLLPAEEALEFSVEYASVVVFGRGRTVRDEEEARSALQLLLDRYAPHLAPGTDYRPITDDELERTAVYRVDIEAWSGKQSAEAPDFPGAFDMAWPAVPFDGSASPAL